MKLGRFGESLGYECDCGNTVYLSCTDFGEHPHATYCYKCDTKYEWSVETLPDGYRVYVKKLPKENQMPESIDLDQPRGITSDVMKALTREKK